MSTLLNACVLPSAHIWTKSENQTVKGIMTTVNKADALTQGYELPSRFSQVPDTDNSSELLQHPKIMPRIFPLNNERLMNTELSESI